MTATFIQLRLPRAIFQTFGWRWKRTRKHKVRLMMKKTQYCRLDQKNIQLDQNFNLICSPSFLLIQGDNCLHRISCFNFDQQEEICPTCEILIFVQKLRKKNKSLPSFTRSNVDLQCTLVTTWEISFLYILQVSNYLVPDEEISFFKLTYIRYVKIITGTLHP